MDVRQRILDAAVRRLGTGGFDGLTISAVAAVSGVSRPTVYAHFGTREQLVSETLVLVAARMLDEIVARVGEPSSAAEFVVETMVAARTAFKAQPALAPVVTPQHGTILFDGDALGPASIEMARTYLAPVLTFHPHLADEMAEIAETCIRTLVSLLLFDSARVRTDEDLRRYLHRRLVPAIGV